MSGRTPPVLGPGREFDRVRAIAQTLGDAARGLGDDCARIDFPPGVPLVSVDASVEGVHFRRDWLRDDEIGWRATMAALSDLAAMGATPTGVVAAVSLPGELDASVLAELMRGVGNAATAVGAAVLGGDLSRGPVCSLSITVLGAAPRPVWRSGARPGDRLWVTGRLGASRAALEALQAGQVPAPLLRHRFAHPEARTAAGIGLAALGATALIDLSDGLAADAAHLAAASAVRLTIELDALPLHRGVGAAAARAAVPLPIFAAGSGEEYELLAALPGDVPPEALAALGVALALPITCIGAVLAGPAAVELRHGVRLVHVPGFDHFHGEAASR